MANGIGKMKMRQGQASNEILVDTLLCALVYDFMAFVSQTLGYDRDFDIQRVRYLRKVMYTQIGHLVKPSFFHEQELHTILIYIVETRYLYLMVNDI